jgi:AbrB family transcriptional regulator (stage V sporulation protein T)
MKATGVVRRIDDLGRIVIPKELRRTMRIREGDSLEIFIDGEKIMLKKYSPVQNVNDFVLEFVESIYSSYKKDMIITDNEVIIAGSGNYKKDLIGKKISPTLENKLTKRTTQYLEKGETLELTANYDIKRPSVIKPINVYGDIIGCVIVSADTDITDVDKTLAEFSGVFMSRYLEG